MAGPGWVVLLARVWSRTPNAVSSVPGQDTYPGCALDPQSGRRQEATD